MIEFRVLGSFEVLEDQRPLALGGPKQRALLAVLLLRRGEAVSSDRLIDALWGERAPASAAKIVQGYVSNLRRALGEGLLITRGHGYLLQTEPGQVDLERFEALATDGRRLLRAGDARAGSERLRDALARQYGLTKLATDTDQDAVRRRHCDYYRRVVEEAVPGLSTHQETIALARLDIEADNILTALHWALDAAPTSALRLAGHLGKYWYIRHDLDGLRWLDATLEAAGESAPVHDRARARLHQSIHLYLRDSYEAGLECANAALALYQRAGDHAGISNALREVAVGIGVTGETERWRELAQLALRHAQLAGDTRTLGKALSALALVPGEDRARLLQQAAQHLTRVGDYGEIAMAYSNAAYTALTEDQVAEAGSLLETALDAVQRTDSPLWDMVIHANVGLAELLSGNFAPARRAYERHLQLCLDHAFVASGEGLAAMAAIAAYDGHYARAARIRGAARSAGYPPTPFDEPIDNRLERDFFATARARHGVANWRSDEEAGASLSYAEAIEYALERPTAARNSQRIESLTSHASEQRRV